MREQILEAINSSIGGITVSEDDKIVDTLDSIGVVEATLECEKSFDITLPDFEYDNNTTIKDFIDFVDSKIKNN